MPKIAHNILQAMIAASIGIGVVFLIVATSQDVQSAGEFGSAWSEQGTNALPVATSLLTSLSFNEQIWAIGGDNGGTATRKVYSSSDGITWAEVGTDALPVATRNHCSLVFDDKMWVIGGEDSAGTALDQVYSSSDGITWSAVGTITPRNGFNGVTGPRCLVHGGLMWAAGGTDLIPGSSKVSFSSDGITWTDVALADDMTSARTEGTLLLSPDGSMVYSGGYNFMEVFQSTVRSETGTGWSAPEAGLPELRRGHGGVSAGGKVYLFGGVGATTPVTASGYNDVLASTDGFVWAEVGNDVLPVAIHSFGYTMFLGKAWIVGGDIAGTQVRTVYATDDIAGTIAFGLDDEPISDIGADVNFTSQSGDTANNQLPFMDMVQNAETSTGYPLVTYTIYMIFLMLAMALMFYLARQAPDNHWIAAIGVIVLCVIGFALGREAIDWWILIAVTAFVTGVASISGKVSA